MTTFLATPSSPALKISPLSRCYPLSSLLHQTWHGGYIGAARIHHLFSINIRFVTRRTLLCATSKDAEESFKKTVEVDYLIDMLRDADEKELQKLVVENVLAFNEGFWIRLAARSDTCKSEDDKKDYEELASSVMSIVELIVHKTKEKIESATDILKDILRPVVDEEEEICWPPRDPDALNQMEKVF